MLDVNTPIQIWVPFFIVCAIGMGISINHPYTAVQAVLRYSTCVLRTVVIGPLNADNWISEADVPTGNGEKA
jgi:hypothetical protein